MSDDIEHIRVWHRTWADCDKSELDALRAENERLREAMNNAIDSLRRSPDHNTETIQAVTHLFLALETKGKSSEV